MSSTVPSLPIEVQLIIVEQVKDRPILTSCSLVCRAWLHITRRALFRQITVVLSGKDDIRYLDFTYLLHTSMRSMHPLGNYIRELTLVGDCHHARKSEHELVLPVFQEIPLVDVVTITHQPIPEGIRGSNLREPGDDSASSSATSGSASGSTHKSSSMPLSQTSFATSLEKLVMYSLDLAPSEPDLLGVSDLLTDGDYSDDTSGLAHDHLSVDSVMNALLLDYAKLSVDTLRAILPLLPHLETLCISQLSFYDDILLSPNIEPSLRRPIKSLFIEDCTSSTMQIRPLFQVISMFSDIGVLYIEWTTQSAAFLMASEPLPPTPPIRGLILGTLEHDDCAAAVYDSIRRSGSLDGPLRSIRFTGYAREEVETFLAFARLTGHRLIDLELDIYHAMYNFSGESSCACGSHPPSDTDPMLELPGSWEAITLDFCGSLETLTLSFDHDCVQPARTNLATLHTTVQLYTHLISSPGALPSVRVVTFQIFRATAVVREFCRSVETSLARSWWARLDDALGWLPALTTVHFMLCDVPDIPSVTTTVERKLSAFLEKCMPKVWASGRAKLVSEDEFMSS